MEQFLSCDWGTSAFRLRLIDAESLAIIKEENLAEGIAQTFQLWKESKAPEDKRLNFYLDIISTHIKALENKSGNSLNTLPLLVSGMASSTIGMINLPYKNLPFCTSGEDLEVFIIEASQSFKHQIFIISGAKTEDDVMRGEETKAVGCASDFENEDQIYIFPGTHPKHIKVKNGKATEFKTYMTGEFFELLSNKSILSVSVKKPQGFELENYLQSFAKGVNESKTSNLLHNCFLVRTNDLFKKLTPEENYYYLSGLLIGAEIKDLVHKNKNITIVGNAFLNNQYTKAFEVLDLNRKSLRIKNIHADEALIKGQIKIYNKFIRQ